MRRFFKRATNAVTIAILLLAVASSVNALCNSTGTTSNLRIDGYRPYNDAGTPMPLTVYYYDAATNKVITGNDTNVTIRFQNNTYGLTYNPSPGSWTVSVVSSASEDVSFMVGAENNYSQCQNITFVSKWRVPFYVYFQLYEQSPNSTNPQEYYNDFQYVVLLDNNQKNRDDLFMQSWDTGMNRLMDKALDAMGGEPVPQAKTPDHNIYFWGEYNGGVGRVKLYEPSNYSVYVMNNKVQLPHNYFEEFQRPTTSDVEFMGKVYDRLAIYNASNVSNTPYSYNLSTYKISFTKWEANSYYVAMNIGLVIFVAVVYFGLAALLLYAFRGSQNLGQIMIVYITIATPVAIGTIVYLK